MHLIIIHKPQSPSLKLQISNFKVLIGITAVVLIVFGVTWFKKATEIPLPKGDVVLTASKEKQDVVLEDEDGDEIKLDDAGCQQQHCG